MQFLETRSPGCNPPTPLMHRLQTRSTKAQCQPCTGWSRKLKSYDHRYADTVDQIHGLVYLPGLASPADTTPILHRRPLWPATADLISHRSCLRVSATHPCHAGVQHPRAAGIGQAPSSSQDLRALHLDITWSSPLHERSGQPLANRRFRAREVRRRGSLPCRLAGLSGGLKILPRYLEGMTLEDCGQLNDQHRIARPERIAGGNHRIPVDPQGNLLAVYMPSRRIPCLLAICKNGVVSVLVRLLSLLLQEPFKIPNRSPDRFSELHRPTASYLGLIRDSVCGRISESEMWVSLDLAGPQLTSNLLFGCHSPRCL